MTLKLHDYSEHEHVGHEHGDGDHAGKTDIEKMTAALADFYEEDRTSAMEQHFFPVSGEMLGTMGEPEKVEVNAVMAARTNFLLNRINSSPS